MIDLCHLPGHELVHLTSSGTVSCREVIEAPPPLVAAQTA
jgi:hypothetical protein